MTLAKAHKTEVTSCFPKSRHWRCILFSITSAPATRKPVGNICCIIRDSLFTARKGLAITNKGKVWKYPQGSTIQRHKEREKWISGTCANLLKTSRQFPLYALPQGQCCCRPVFKRAYTNIKNNVILLASVLCTWKGVHPQLRSNAVKMLRRWSARAAPPWEDAYSTSHHKVAEPCIFPLSLFCGVLLPGDLNLPEYLLAVPGLSRLTCPQKCVCVCILLPNF